MAQHAPLVAVDRAPLGTICIDHHSRYVMLVKVANKDTQSVVSELIKQSQRLPSELYRSLTWNRGKELADHPAPDIGHRGRRLLL